MAGQFKNTRARTAGANCSIDLQTEVIDRLYGVALNPETMNDLVDHWSALMTPQWRRSAHGRNGMLESSGLLRHFSRVEQVLYQQGGRHQCGAEENELRRYRRAAAFTLSGSLRISAMNHAAAKMLGAQLGDTLSCLQIRDEDLAALSRAAFGLNRRARADSLPPSQLIRARRLVDDRLVLMLIRLIQRDGAPDGILVATTEVDWSNNATRLLRDAYHLTQAEAEVMVALTESNTLKDIARSRGRSVDTIRTQVKSILTKTEAHGQNDLLRLAISVMNIAPPETLPDVGEPADRTRISRGGVELPPLPFSRIARPDGRWMEYLEFGDPKGRPTLFYCSNHGLCRWPASGEFTAAQAGLRVIVPVRPGYGGSTPISPTDDRMEICAQDCIALMDQLHIPSAHLLVLDADMMFASHLHKKVPERVLGVLGVSALLPLGGAEHYERMGRWQKFMLGAARFTPQVLPFLVPASLAMARRMGKAEFVRMAYGNSAADVAITRSPRQFEAMASGSEILLGGGIEAARAFAQEVALIHGTDWRPDFDRMRGRIPVANMIGTENQTIARETLREYQRDYPWVRFVVLENTGSFLFFQRWPEVLQELERLMSNPQDVNAPCPDVYR